MFVVVVVCVYTHTHAIHDDGIINSALSLCTLCARTRDRRPSQLDVRSGPDRTCRIIVPHEYCRRYCRYVRFPTGPVETVVNPIASHYRDFPRRRIVAQRAMKMRSYISSDSVGLTLGRLSNSAATVFDIQILSIVRSTAIREFLPPPHHHSSPFTIRPHHVRCLRLHYTLLWFVSSE